MTTTHPRGLYPLFFTEMWERMSYYGMRALLVLYMVAPAERGGLGMSDPVAAAIYGLYTAGVYLSALPGGWIADRLLGAQRSVWVGGWLIAAGHFSLAIPGTVSFFAGLVLVALGTGLLKPNVSTLVGALYPGGGARRDAGFTVFYLGINLGATLGPLVCSTLGEKVHWHWGFGAAGLGMAAGLVQWAWTRRELDGLGHPPIGAAGEAFGDWAKVGLGLGGLGAVFVATAAGWIHLDPLALARWSTLAIVGLAGLWFGWLFLGAGLEATEKRRLGVVAVLFLASALFWGGYEQAGSSLNLFADRYTRRMVAGFEVPAGWFQALPAALVMAWAPVVAWGWLRLEARGVVPALPLKIAGGLLLLAAGFLVLAAGSRQALATGPVGPGWLAATYLLHVWGELLLSPVGLSSVTQLAPARRVGQVMGLWFLATSLGNLLAGLLAGSVGGDQAAQMPARFLQVVMLAGGAGLGLALVARRVQGWMGTGR